jgi:4-hydroxy-tetrahydrodipicolinate reductase
MNKIPVPFKVLQFGLGTMGRIIAQTLMDRGNLELVGAVDVNPEYTGKSVEEVLGSGHKTSTSIFNSLESALRVLGNQPADIALIATLSSLDDIASSISDCFEAGMDVVSLCEELSYPYIRHPELSRNLDRLAKKHEKTVLGTGINPGFLMDFLPICLSAPCQRVDTIRVTRRINSSRRRTSFQKKIGTGMSPANFKKAISEGSITGHVGLVESIRMIDDALNLELDSVVELPPEPVIASADIETPVADVKKGDVIGLKSIGVGRKQGTDVVTLSFIAHAGAEPEFDEVCIEGYPKIVQRIESGVQGDHGTVGMVLNMIPLVIEAQSGLFTMKDLPCPRNTQSFWRSD